MAASADAASSQIEVGPSWKDTDGNLVEAHGGAANKYNEADLGIDITGDGDKTDDVYLLYGEKKTNATRPVDGVNGYWSTDLENWHYMGNVLRTHNVLPDKVISITGDASYTDYDSQQYFADHKVSQDGTRTDYAAGSQKYTVLDETNLQQLKDLANSGDDTENAKSAKAFIEPYVTKRDSNGKAITYDEASLKIGFEYLYGMYNIVERPKVVYNKATKQFVAIFHSDGAVNANADRIKWIEGLAKSGRGATGGKTYFEQGVASNDATAKNTGSRYSRAQIGFAVSDTPFGPFKMVNATRMNFDKSLHATRFGESRDMTVFVDYGHDVNNDGADDAYAVYSSEMNAKMYISLLNKEYTAPIAAGDSEPEGDHTWRSRVLPDNSREASALFFYGGWYYMVTSGTDGWNSTPVIYYRAKSVLQDAVWERLGNPFVGASPDKGYDSQPTYMLVKDQEKGQFIYMGDRWVVDGRTGSAGKDSKLIWLPIELTGDESRPIQISGRASWDPFDESLYRAPKNYGSIVLEQGSLLPETLKIDGKDVKVAWPDGANDQVASAAAGATLSLNFTADGARYTASVQIIAPGLTYYVDSGAKDEASAAEYAAVKSAVKGLKNAAPDQVSDGTNWGYVSANVVAKSDAGNGKADTGLYTNNSGKVISYKLPLDAGSYTLNAGFHDWWAQWTDNRAMNLKVTAAEGTELGKSSAATSKTTADATGTVSFTLDKAQTVTFSVTRAANATADPILNWFTVSKQATAVDGTVVATAGKLPATVSIDGKDTAVTWSDASVAAASARASIVASINATGSADGTPVSATVLNVPANTVYFADSGATASGVTSTPDYDAVKAALGDALLNQSADQQWDGKASGKTWGYSGGTNTGVVDAKANGWNNSFVSADYDSNNGQITYHLTLKAGRYDIGAVQSHVKYPNGIYSTVKVGDETIGARKTLTGLSDANDTLVQSVEVAKDSVVDVTVGTDGTAGYNLRLAAVWAARTGDITPPTPPVDKDDLQAEMDRVGVEADKLDPDDYTTTSWDRLRKARAVAQSVYDDGNATQDEVDAARDELTAALKALIPVSTGGTTVITKKQVSITGVTAADAWFDGKAHVGFEGTPSSDFKGSYEITYRGSGSTVYGPSKDAPTAAGTYRVTVSVPESDRTWYGSLAVEFSIRSGSTVVGRFYAPGQDRHMWTASAAESGVLPGMGWNREGDAFTMDSHAGEPVYRLYDAHGNQHLWTTSVEERDYLVSQHWNDEGVAFYENPTAKIDVYRLYNPWTGEHLWTTSILERDSLTSSGQWTYEGVAFKALS